MGARKRKDTNGTFSRLVKKSVAFFEKSTRKKNKAALKENDLQKQILETKRKKKKTIGVVEKKRSLDNTHRSTEPQNSSEYVDSSHHSVVDPQHDVSTTAQFELPDGYNQTKIVAVIRDPYWVYVYWDLDNAQKKHLAQLFITGGAYVKTVLRVHDVGGVEFDGFNSNRFCDVVVQLDARNWYLDLGSPNKNIIIDLGIKDSRNIFFLIARSNRIAMPADGPSQRVDEDWMISDTDFEEFYTLSGGYEKGVSSEHGIVKKKKKGFRVQETKSSTMPPSASER
ncbi:MAG: DUF4912 domain-containing protein [Candidatus Omnitrophica bacterium]|nr:DUF4912 domain-containing protein [Candidatus Omnitrophota bacterium]